METTREERKILRDFIDPGNENAGAICRCVRDADLAGELLEALESATFALLTSQHSRRVAQAVKDNGWRWTEDCPDAVDSRTDAAIRVIAKAHGEG